MKGNKSKQITNNNENLKQRVIRSGFWMAGIRFFSRGFTFIKMIILAHFLSPNDFGLFGIALLSMSVLETFSIAGFQESLIQKKEETLSYLNTAWTVLVFRGIIIFVIMYFAAPYIADFFNVPAAELVIQVIGLSILLQGLNNIAILYFQKELEFHKQFIYDVGGAVVDFSVVVIFVIMWGNIWALVFGLLAGQLVRTILSFSLQTYRPHFEFDKEKAKEMFSFGRWVLGSSIIIFLVTYGDDILVGKLLGVTALGFYQMAYIISNTPATEISHVISKVTFPTYSILKDNIDRLKKAYYNVLHLTALLSFLLASLIFVLAKDFTIIFLGEKWVDMIPAMQILVLAGLVRSIASTSGIVFFAVGKPIIDTKLQIIRFIVLAILIYPLIIRYNILGASIAVLASIFISNIGFTYMVVNITKCSVKKLLKILVIPMIGGFIIILLITIIRYFIELNFLKFIIIVFISILIYLISTHLLYKIFNCEEYNIKILIKRIFKLRSDV